MKRLGFILLLIFLVGCGTLHINNPFDRPCSVCDEWKASEGAITSPICEQADKLKQNPCAVHAMMVVAAKEGLVLELWQADQFEKWMNEVKKRIEAGITYGDLKILAFAQLTKFNSMVGGTFLVMSEFFLSMPDGQIVPEYDQNLLYLSVDDLVVQVKRFALYWG